MEITNCDFECEEIHIIWSTLKWIYMKDEESFILGIWDVFYLYTLYADCCSNTYLSDIIKNISLKSYPWFEGYIISGYEELDLKEWEYKPRESRQECDTIYWVKILLECEWDEPNSITIIYRNSSNWYYGWWHQVSKIDKIPEWYYLVKNDYSNPF